jgi:hypothetical protein
MTRKTANSLAASVKSGHRILVINGAGQQELWEDVAGRLGDIGTVRALRSNIVKVAGNSAQAKQAWTDDNSIDAGQSRHFDSVSITAGYAPIPTAKRTRRGVRKRRRDRAGRSTLSRVIGLGRR